MMIVKLTPFLFIFLFSMCPKGGIKEREAPYELPPVAPIPPQKTCYELKQGEKGQDITRLELIIEGDSVFGNMDRVIGQKKVEHGSIAGILYRVGDGFTLF